MLQRRDVHPNEPFLKWKDDEIMWRDFVDHIYAVAAGFWESGIRTGDRVALMMGNCPEFLYAYYALVFMGVGAVPLNIAQRGEALAYILNDSGASAIVIDDVLVEHFIAIKDRVSSVRLMLIRGTLTPMGGNAFAIGDWLKAGGGRPP